MNLLSLATGSKIHQYQGSAGPYEVMIDGNPLTWEEALGPYHLEGQQGNALFEHIGYATDAAFHRICDLRVQKGEITQEQALLVMHEAKRLFWKKVGRAGK